jgi:hypothetical protein
VSSTIPQVCDALVGVLAAALPSIEVSDGAVVQNVERAGLTVGASLDDSTFTWEQDWVPLSTARPMDETFDVPCTLWVRAGDNDLATYRDEVFGYWSTVLSTLRENYNLGITTNSLRTLLRPRGYSQPRTPDGVVCRIDFDFRVTARI